MRNTSDKAQGDMVWKRCKAAGEAGGYITMIEMYPDGSKAICGDTLNPLWCDNADPVWKQAVTQSLKPAGFDARSYAQAGIKRDQSGSTSFVMAPSNTSKWYICQEAIILVLTGRGTTCTMSPQTSYVSFANNSIPRARGPFMRVHPTNENLVLWGHGEGLTLTKDGFATDATKLSGFPTPTNSDCATTVVFSLDGSKAYAHCWGQGLYVLTNLTATSPTITKVDRSPLYAGRMTLDQNGKLWLTTLQSNGVVVEGSNNIWTYSNNNLYNITTCPLGAEGIAIDPSNANRIIALTQESFASQSLDGGATWTSTWFDGAGGGFGIYFRAEDVPYLDSPYKRGSQIAGLQFDPSATNKLYLTDGVGVWWSNYPTPQNVITWNSQSEGIWQLIPYSFASHIGKVPVFGNQDRPIFRSYAGLDVGPPDYRAAGFSHGWHLAPSRVNPGFTAVTMCSDQSGIVCGWTDDHFDTFNVYANQPFSGNTMAGGASAVSANKNRIICAPGANLPAVYTLDRGATPWQLLQFPGLPSGCSAGQYAYYMIRQILCPDSVDPDEFIYYHPGINEGGGLVNPSNAGLFRINLSSSGPIVQKMYPGFPCGSDSSVQAFLEAIPGHAGQYIFAGDSHGARVPLALIKDRGATVIQLPAIKNCRSVDFGASKPGSSEPTTWVLGEFNSIYGVHYTTDYPDNSATWNTFAVLPVDDFVGWPGFIRADRNEFGLVYAGMGGKGWVYGKLTDRKVLV